MSLVIMIRASQRQRTKTRDQCGARDTLSVCLSVCRSFSDSYAVKNGGKLLTSTGSARSSSLQWNGRVIVSGE